MKVILLKDVAKIGRRFDIVVVPDGFALNKLIPNNMAQAATPENMKRILHVSSKRKEDQAEQSSTFKEMLKALEDIKIEISVESNAEGRMFQALKPSAIAQAIKSTTGFEVSEGQMVIKTPIKSVGDHQIELISGDTHGTATLSLTHTK